jgi:hypothetical protein
MSQNFLSTKFVLCVVIILMGFVFVLLDKTTSDVFFEFVKWVTGGYIVGNVADKFSPLLNDKK